ncbi:hypothetical protein HMPREF9103_01615 [Lentilactobacillus parafarraginis F0439]|uniref:DUF5698 domain-containing protein n=1 Tax=Lentilactobacillus parafarraginis F0439 TaxID=797515 RepID=G9ZPG1_9LACO|nr:hypothetical protein HMPREF9103_01615 [Lentilactobacillus parafarraginis F0439]
MGLAITIFVLNALYISINTFRTMLVVKGHQFLAPIVAVGEEVVYVLALAIALDHIEQSTKRGGLCDWVRCRDLYRHHH